MTPRHFRKKPVAITAMHWDGTESAATPIVDWVLDRGGDARLVRQGEWHPLRTRAEMRKEWSDSCKAWLEIARDTAPPFLVIKTLEGDMRASSGDWIIEGVKREHYPCRADIFAATYEEV